MEICIEAGIGLSDTADIYSFGKSKEVLGQALGTRRKDIVLATRSSMDSNPAPTAWASHAATILHACEASRAVSAPTLDLYQAHDFDALHRRLDETVRVFEDPIPAGDRYAGCSNDSAGN